MKRDKFYELANEHDNAIITFYHKSEIPCVIKMKIDSVEDYDDEIIIRSSDNTFIILQGDPAVRTTDDEEEEFIFGMGNIDVGAVVR